MPILTLERPNAHRTALAKDAHQWLRHIIKKGSRETKGMTRNQMSSSTMDTISTSFIYQTPLK